MNREDHDDLWELLGKARQTPVSPFFSRNVLREIRNEPQRAPGLLDWLRLHWRLASVGSVAIIVASFGAWSQIQDAQREQREQQLTALAEEVSASPDYAVITQLDDLLAMEENSVWLEASLR